MSDIHWLPWDSDVLGIKVARLTAAQYSTEQLRLLLTELAHQGARLVYWAAASDCLRSQQAAAELKGFLADRKITYLCRLADLNYDIDYCHVIEPYQSKLPEQELFELAYLSGLYSRFRMDKEISQTQFEEVYRVWMTNSVNRQIADDVLVIKYQQHIAGMITLGEKQGRGDIGLLAVHPSYQGMKMGAALVTAAQRYFAPNYQWSQVVTQEANMPARHLYERCGYHLEKIENFYHFWL